MEDFAALTTETRSPYTDLDSLETIQILRIINTEDSSVPLAVERELPQIAQAVNVIVNRLAGGGRLFYVGAGTSGRLGVLDAAECPPTFGVPELMVQGVIAGRTPALCMAVEGVEDDAAAGETDLAERGCDEKDAVVAIAASGRTPYCLGALRYARQVGAAAIALVCNAGSPMAQSADITIAPIVGPEVVTGSTRMKAGTAQKMVLNMLSTTSMIKLGKVYGNLMVDLTPANSKLVARSRQIVLLATGADISAVDAALEASQNNVKVAIVILLASCSAERATALLDAAQGSVRTAIIMGKK